MPLPPILVLNLWVVIATGVAWELLQQCSEHDISAARWTDHFWSMEWEVNTSRLHAFVPDVGFPPPGVDLPRLAWVRLNRLRTGVGRFRSSMHKWGLAPSAACECGAEEQTTDHIILECPMYRAPNGDVVDGGVPRQIARVCSCLCVLHIVINDEINLF